MHSLHGKACLVKGGLWAMEEELGGLPSFVSPRPANHKAIPALARALVDDIKYSVPENYMKGAGDTYFSGEYSSPRLGAKFNSMKAVLTLLFR